MTKRQREILRTMMQEAEALGLYDQPEIDIVALTDGDQSDYPEGMAVVGQSLRDIPRLVAEVEVLQVLNADLLAALKIARQYVAATHASIAGAVGSNNLVYPDLATVDSAIARAEARQ